VEIRVVDGERATNRPGAAEYLGRSLQTVNLWASPGRRAATGWPDPVGTLDRQQWYALGDLDRFRASYIEVVEAAGQARVHEVTLDGDPEELITAKQFRSLIRVGHRTWSRWVWESQPAWKRGADGYLPRPDDEQPARHGTIRKWRRRRVVAWINARPGKAPSPGRPPRNDTEGCGEA
jgi:hypothetical protein